MSKSVFTANTIPFKAGEVIFRQGYPGDHAYIIKSGEVLIIKEHDDGTREQVATLRAGEMFGEIAVLDEVARTATAQAHTDCVLQVMEI